MKQKPVNLKPFAYISVNGKRYPLRRKDIIGKPITDEAGRKIGTIIDFDIYNGTISSSINEGEPMPKIEFGVEM